MAQDLNRRVFLERVGACGIGGAAISDLLNRRAHGQAPGNHPGSTTPNAGTWSPPRLMTNPNILVIMVDQMRAPMWLTSGQMATLNQQYLPNIWGKIRNNSYSFQQYYVAAAMCTASRATMLTGLYAPQTCMYLNTEEGKSPVSLNAAFPTWAEALAALNPIYQNNCWWFGKWHLSNCTNSDPLLPYGFRTGDYPGGPANNPSPNGVPNEGSNGGLFQNTTYASDSQIADDFVAWLQNTSPAGSPWCATVSFVNPHDIVAAPAWLHEPVPPPGLPSMPVYFHPPDFGNASDPSRIYQSPPSPWNYENLQSIPNKPAAQLAYQQTMVQDFGKVTDWTLFLNQYYWLQHYVDEQVGKLLDAVDGTGQTTNTIILFTSDHGEYAGSHGLHGKGYSAYEESIRVPLYLRFPGQSGCVTLNQMCSSVDVFGLICDLGTQGGRLWKTAYPDLYPRQCIWDFVYSNSSETRVAPALCIPYVLHTCDVCSGVGATTKKHVVGFRTKTNRNNAQPGAKLVTYSAWDACSTIPNATPADCEFYDYNPLTSNNGAELGNDYYSSNATTQSTIPLYQQVLGSWGPPATGLIADELNAPLTGTGRDGRPLSLAQATARQNYFNAVAGAGKCTVG